MADARLPWVAMKTACAPERAQEILRNLLAPPPGRKSWYWLSHGSLRGCHGLSLMAAPGHPRVLNHEILLASTDDASLPSCDEARPVLGADERVRAAQFHFPVHRERWVRCRAWLRIVLAERCGTTAAALRFEFGPWGKPVLARPHDPAWASCPQSRPSPACNPDSERTETGHPNAIHFNVSHSGAWAALIIGPAEAGIDVEVIDRDRPVLELADEYFLREEADDIRSAQDQHLRFFQYWTAKEAVMKATGRGLSLEPRDIRVSLSTQSAERLDCGERYELFSFQPATDIVVAAAARMPGSDGRM